MSHDSSTKVILGFKLFELVRLIYMPHCNIEIYRFQQYVHCIFCQLNTSIEQNDKSLVLLCLVWHLTA